MILVVYVDRLTISVLIIIDRCEAGKSWSFYSSDVLDDEISRIPYIIKKQQVYNLYCLAETHIELNSAIVDRAKELVNLKFAPFDALHLSSAEYSKVDVFLTADKGLISRAKQIGIKVRVENPLIWIMEVFDERKFE